MRPSTSYSTVATEVRIICNRLFKLLLDESGESTTVITPADAHTTEPLTPPQVHSGRQTGSLFIFRFWLRY
ncbi:uncharacterized protein B0H18DRAFT_681892 [Fomitopsis serialis]|uniref:uncharacterized protein n=1 Tax=Fomitopsis serialis TaxID=139415 RepID=UPI00200805DE|nr:uncharacterized protein B0H18DRAFT_681892 [Neoantrodia serialis]KAH9918050.1 hypothetical protein B0H18DRAFT_681892 [Neoantrodia serialis]